MSRRGGKRRSVARAPKWLRSAAAVVVIAVVLGGIAFAVSVSDPALDGDDVGMADDAPALAEPTPPERNRDAGAGPLDAALEPGPADAHVASAPDDQDGIQCYEPALEIPRSAGCDRDRPYPHCRWRIPAPGEDAAFGIWRNTTPDHRWGRPGLVSLILGSATEYRRRWPGERLVVGDLDAPGPRHATHMTGVDVDLYLPHAMLARNERGGSYPDNYEGRTPAQVRMLRARVLDLAKILATCAGGNVRIYYNDPDIIRPFRAWFDEQGMQSSVGEAMRTHNPLHRFHFHLSVPPDLEPLPRRAQPPEGQTE